MTLERLTINLIPRAQAAVDTLMRSRQSSKTDAVNWGLQLAAFIQEQTDAGKQILIRAPGSDEAESMKFF